jgi:hypothetical protein
MIKVANKKAVGFVLVLIITFCLVGGAFFMANTAGNNEARAEQVVAP